MTESLGISVSAMCYQCQALSELCPDCQELKDSRDADIAHQIVDEGNLQYQYVWSQTQSDLSGHDWIGSVVKISERTKRYKVRAEMTDTSIREYLVIEESEDHRSEFLDPISVLTDRFYDLETSITITSAEVICQDCHLVYNKWSNCPNCN